MIDQVAGSQRSEEESAGEKSIPRRYQIALSRCSQTLLRAALTPAQRLDLLNEALAFLVAVAEAGRAYVIQEFEDEEGVLCLRLVAEACAPGVYAHLSAAINQHIPWSLLGRNIRDIVAGGQIMGGPTAEIFAANPNLVQTFHGQINPLLSLLMLPLIIDGAFWGMVGMDDVKHPRQWGEDEIVVLRTAAGIFASTLHRWELEDQLREQTARDATQAERQRLAQNLHDVITQTLYGLTLMARTGREALREGDAELLAESLAGIEENALAAQRDMRILLYQLGPLDLPTRGGLEVALRDRLRRVERRLGLETELRIDPAITLADGVVESLYFVITEALNNSLQHAAATRVAVSLVREGERLLLEVQDNGRGFRGERVEPGMGLAQIARRARALNAEMLIDAAPGAGTRISLMLPVGAGGAVDG